MIDIHNHILPGVDDGSSSWEESLDMARCAMQDGIHTIICTPHMNAESDDLSILAKYAELREQLQQRLQVEGLELRLLSGAEWMLTPDLAQVVDHVGRLGESKAFLFELSPFMPVFAPEGLIKDVLDKGLQPILAHPERYPMINANNYASIQHLVEKGCILQITSGSLLGDFGKKAQKNAEYLVRAFPKAIVIASDAHHAKVREPLLRSGYRALNSLIPGLAKRVQEKLNTVFAPTLGS